MSHKYGYGVAKVGDATLSYLTSTFTSYLLLLPLLLTYLLLPCKNKIWMTGLVNVIENVIANWHEDRRSAIHPSIYIYRSRAEIFLESDSDDLTKNKKGKASHMRRFFSIRFRRNIRIGFDKFSEREEWIFIRLYSSFPGSNSDRELETPDAPAPDFDFFVWRTNNCTAENYRYRLPAVPITLVSCSFDRYRSNPLIRF